jgi:zinc-ribbon domain
MSPYCERCGNQLRPGAKFCHSCGAGAPVQTSAPPSSGYQPQSYPQSPQGWSSPPPSYVEPPTRSSSVAKFIIISLLVILGFVGVVGIGAWVLFRRAVRSVNVTEDSSGRPAIAIKPPGGGELKIGAGSAVTEAELGVPIYPGSTPSKDGGSVSISGSGVGGMRNGWVGVATFTTEDSVDQVQEFYREKLGKNMETFDQERGGKRTVVFNTKTGRGLRTITITDEPDTLTKIAIVNIGKAAAAER